MDRVAFPIIFCEDGGGGGGESGVVIGAADSFLKVCGRGMAVWSVMETPDHGCVHDVGVGQAVRGMPFVSP